MDPWRAKQLKATMRRWRLSPSVATVENRLGMHYSETKAANGAESKTGAEYEDKYYLKWGRPCWWQLRWWNNLKVRLKEHKIWRAALKLHSQSLTPRSRTKWTTLCAKSTSALATPSKPYKWVTFATLKSHYTVFSTETNVSKETLSHSVDAIVPIGHAVGESSALIRMERIKPALKPEFYSLCTSANESHTHFVSSIWHRFNRTKLSKILTRG